MIGIRCLGAAALLTAGLATAGAAPGVAGVVYVDEGHGQPFRVGGRGDLDLSGLAGLLREAGAEVRAGAGRLDDAALAGADALVISGAFAAITPAEVEAVRRFMARGGRLGVMLHIAAPVRPLLEALGIQHSRAPLREVQDVMEGRPTDFVVTRLTRHPLTAGVERFVVFGCFGLRIHGPGRVLAETGPRAWPDTDNDGRPSGTEPVGRHAVMVGGEYGAGGFVVFGDDALFQNRFLARHNRALGARLAAWLAGSRRGRSPAAAGTTPL